LREEQAAQKAILKDMVEGTDAVPVRVTVIEMGVKKDVPVHILNMPSPNMAADVYGNSRPGRNAGVLSHEIRKPAPLVQDHGEICVTRSSCEQTARFVRALPTRGALH